MHITINFITGLYVSISYNIILKILNFLTKTKHYILCTINDNSTTTEVMKQEVVSYSRASYL